MDEAVQYFAAALLLNADHLPSLLALGAALSEQRRWDDARRVYERTVRRFPDVTVADVRLRNVLEHLARSESLIAEEGRQARSKSSEPRQLIRVSQSSRDVPRATLLWQARITGALSFLFVLATYVLVGLAVYWTVGLAAAAAIAVLITVTASHFFPGARWFAFRGILQGMLVGLTVLLLLGLVSVLIALSRESGAAG